MAIAVGAHWAFSVCFAISTPYMIRNIGWGTFLFFAIFDAVNAVGSWLIVHETRGKSLEYLDHEFKAEVIGEDAVQREEAATEGNVKAPRDMPVSSKASSEASS